MTDSMKLWECLIRGQQPHMDIQLIIKGGVDASNAIDIGALAKVDRSLVKEAHDLAVKARKRTFTQIVL